MTTGLVVVVTGGLVVVVVGGLVVGGGDTCGAEAGGTVVGGGTVVVVGTTEVDGLVVDGDVAPPEIGPEAFAPADEPGCSRATVTPMIVARRPAAATDVRVTRRMRASAAARA